MYMYVTTYDRIHEELGQQTDEQILEDNFHREPYDHMSKTIDFRKVMPTDIKNNPRAMTGGNRPPKEEALLTTRNTLIEHNVLEYIASQPNLENLTKSERRGLKKLARRVKSGEIVVYTTDKSSKLAIATRESYEQQGDVHCSGDPIVTWDEAAMSKKIILGHCKALNRILRIGESHGRQSMERAWEAKELDSSTVPVVIFLARDHKAAETNGDPKTRPVCCCSTSINGEMSEYVSHLLEAALSAQGSKESISTEDLLSMVDNAVKKTLELGYPPGEIFIGSLDVKAFIHHW